LSGSGRVSDNRDRVRVGLKNYGPIPTLLRGTTRFTKLNRTAEQPEVSSTVVSNLQHLHDHRAAHGEQQIEALLIGEEHVPNADHVWELEFLWQEQSDPPAK